MYLNILSLNPKRTNSANSIKNYNYLPKGSVFTSIINVDIYMLEFRIEK